MKLMEWVSIDAVKLKDGTITTLDVALGLAEEQDSAPAKHRWIGISKLKNADGTTSYMDEIMGQD